MYKTQLLIDVSVPVSQEVRYEQGVLETLKFALVQYLPLVIPCILLFVSLFGFLFKY